MKTILMLSTFVFFTSIGCAVVKDACSAIDSVYAVDVAALVDMTGLPADTILAMLQAACSAGGDAAVKKEIADLKSVAMAAKSKAESEKAP